MRLTEDQRTETGQILDTLPMYAGRLADLAMATGKRDFVMASSNVEGAKMVLITILTDDKNEELNGPKAPSGPQLVDNKDN